MHNYLFFPGRHPLLSLTELSAYFKNNEIVNFSDTTIEIECQNTPTSIGQIMKNIGGTTKVAKVIKSLPSNIPVNTLTKEISDILTNEFKDSEGKKHFGISQYKSQFDLKRLISGIKKNLKENNFSIRFVNKNFQNLSTDQIVNEKLTTEKGCEIVMVRYGENILIAKTIAVQDIESYSKRDYGRPGRDARRGMIPPKLAQMMINIGKPETEDAVIWDPFCGTGVIVMESLLMGYEAIGSDKDEKAIDLAEENIPWLYEHFGYKQKAKIFVHDVRDQLREKFEIDAIVSEPYLGPRLSHELPINQIMRIIEELEYLYISFFRNIKPIISDKTKIIFLFPCFKFQGEFIFLEKILEKLNRLGYNSLDLIDPDLQEKLNIEIGPEKSLIYSRPNQFVGREIWCFQKK